jgi:Holliday junction resolvase RusA-like endonuclease
MPTHTFTIPGPPQGKARPRVSKNGHVYTPQKTRDYERHIRDSWAEQCPHVPLTGAVRVQVIAYFPWAKSWTKAKKQAAADGVIFPTGRPDADNILKIVCDALNGLAWVDDSRCVVKEVRKKYAVGQEPHVDVEYKEIGLAASEF